jgi:general secretion pathway protein H
MQTSATGSAAARVVAVSDVQRGFTLAELLVVLAILCIVAALLPWTLSRALPHRRLDAAAETLVTELRLAHLQTAMAGHPLEFLVADIGEYSTRELATEPAQGSSQGRARVTDAHGRQRASLTLYPDGSTSGGRIELRDGTNHRVIVVSELTGRVWIERAGARDGR